MPLHYVLNMVADILLIIRYLCRLLMARSRCPLKIEIWNFFSNSVFEKSSPISPTSALGFSSKIVESLVLHIYVLLFPIIA